MFLGSECFRLGPPDDNDLVVIEGDPGTGHEETMYIAGDMLSTAKMYASKDPAVGACLDLIVLGQKDLVRLTEVSIMNADIKSIYVKLLQGDQAAEAVEAVESEDSDLLGQAALPFEEDWTPGDPEPEAATKTESETERRDDLPGQITLPFEENGTPGEPDFEEEPKPEPVVAKEPEAGEDIEGMSEESESEEAVVPGVGDGSYVDYAALPVQAQDSNEESRVAEEVSIDQVVQLTLSTLEETLRRGTFGKYLAAAGENQADWAQAYGAAVASLTPDPFAFEELCGLLGANTLSADTIDQLLYVLRDQYAAAKELSDTGLIDALFEPLAKIFFKE